MSGTEQYLLAIYIESHHRREAVPPGAVADRLDKSSPSVTEMLQQLDERGLVTYEPYEGVTLTETGYEQAKRLHESYVTLSWFFRSVLDLDTHESEAMEMAGVIAPSVTERLAAMLQSDKDNRDYI